MKPYATSLLAAVGLACVSATAAIAAPDPDQDGGLVQLHTLRREGGKVCMADHEHHGSSAGHPARRAAEFAAAQDWAGWVNLEYGPAWARYTLAGSKRMVCSQGSGGWGCEVDARPCRAGR